MRIVSPAIQWAHRVRSIKPSGDPQRRRELRLSFAKLKWKHLLRNSFPGRFANRESFLGLTVDFVDFESFFYLFEEIFLDQQYGFVSAEARPFILDCGSNIGLSLLSFKRQYPQARIVAFEPNPAVFPLLEKNVSQNSLEGVELVNAALSDREGPVDFYAGESGRATLVASCLQARGRGAKMTVPAVRLSSYADRQVDFLKMDIEGAEGVVLQELEASGTLRNVRNLAIEFHHNIPSTNGAPGIISVLSILERNGFAFNLAANQPGPAASPAAGQFQDILIHASRVRE